jgi:methionine biosynthesis protein MetW
MPIGAPELGPFGHSRDSSRYESDLAVPQDGYERNRILLEWIGEGKRVLEVGCSTGYMSRAMVQRGCCVTGIEVDPVAADRARAYCREVHVLDLSAPDWIASVPEREFDVVLLGDVLEHLVDPAQVLRQAVSLLRTNSSLVISLPNVVHWRTRLRILLGQFDYQSTGTLDHTHLRFFTKKTARELIESSGYRIVRSHLVVGGKKLGPARPLWQWLGCLVPGLLAIQMLFEVKKACDR